jgi:hypothetical protein
MLPQRLSLQIDNALFRPAILGKPLRNAASVRLGRILAGGRCRQIRVRDLFGHFLFRLVGVVQVASEEALACYLSWQVRIAIGKADSKRGLFEPPACFCCVPYLSSLYSIHALDTGIKKIERRPMSSSDQCSETGVEDFPCTVLCARSRLTECHHKNHKSNANDHHISSIIYFPIISTRC